MKTELTRSTPSKEGVCSEHIIHFLNACEEENAEIHGIMIARHGKVIFEAYQSPYAADIPHIIHSFTKVLTNTAVALAWADGLLRLDDPLLKFFPEQEEKANEFLRACTIRDMITMRNGQARGIGGNEWRQRKTSWKEAYFEVPFDKQPGKTYLYSSGNSYILSWIVQKLEGKTCKELIQERVGNVIGLTDFSWMKSPEGVCSGGNGVSLTTEDMMRIGLLYLNKGRWNGQQIIPEEWIEYAMGYRDPLEPVDGVQYNFHWEHEGDIWAARGMFGQICGLVPESDMVFAITAADKKDVMMKLFQREILDPMKMLEKEDDPKAMDEILLQKGLRMTLKGKNQSAPNHRNLPLDLIFVPEENEDRIRAVELHFENENTLQFVLEDFRGRHEVKAGLDCWVDGVTSMTGGYLHHQYEQPISRISALAYWNDPDTLMMEWRFPEMAFFDHVSLRWQPDGVVLMDRWVNMNSQDLRRPTVRLIPQERQSF